MYIWWIGLYCGPVAILLFSMQGIVSDAFDGAHTGVLSEIMKNEKQNSIQTRLKSTYNEKNGDKKISKNGKMFP